MSNLVKSSQECLSCGSKRGKAIYDTNEHCFSCGEHLNKTRTFAVRESQTSRLPWTGKLPDDYTNNIPDIYANWLGQFNLEPFFRIGWSDSLNRLVLPI